VSLLWSHRDGPVRYEVRTAGRTRRLYTNGVLHSQYNPRRPFGSGVWDLLALPALLLGPGAERSVLMLGVGAGTCLHLLSMLLDTPRLCAIERNPVHLDIGRRYFDIEATGAELVEGDAVRWLRRGRERFDLVVDDLFTDNRDNLGRAVSAGPAWFERLSARLAPGGLLVMNFCDRAELSRSAWMRLPQVRAALPHGLCLTTPAYGNVVAVFGAVPLDGRLLRRRLAALARRRPQWGLTQRPFTVQRLAGVA
jgi:spermidine synthase